MSKIARRIGVYVILMMFLTLHIVWAGELIDAGVIDASMKGDYAFILGVIANVLLALIVHDAADGFVSMMVRTYGKRPLRYGLLFTVITGMIAYGFLTNNSQIPAEYYPAYRNLSILMAVFAGSPLLQGALTEQRVNSLKRRLTA